MPRIDDSSRSALVQLTHDPFVIDISIPEGAAAPLVHNVDQRQTWLFSARILPQKDSIKKTPKK